MVSLPAPQAGGPGSSPGAAAGVEGIEVVDRSTLIFELVLGALIGLMISSVLWLALIVWGG